MTMAPERPIALVTGASRGIGRAIALRLAATHDIVAVARSANDLARVASEVVGAGANCHVVALDVTDAAAVDRRLASLHVDVLVNNAGIGIMRPLLELAPEEWRRMMDVNVNALYHVTRAVLPGMVARGRGHVVTIGSLAGRSSFAGGTAYAGTKHFVIGFSESLMLEVREHGVKVSVVMPGSVNTDFGRGGDKRWALAAEDVAEAVAHVVHTPPHVLVSRVELRPRTAGK
jgi:NADP-dependent 3-hydroxy acid dehydrogenase YdfG